MPALSSDEQFRTVLNVAEAQLRNRRIIVRFGPSGKARFTVDESSVKELLAQSGLELAAFRNILNNEIGPLLDALMQGTLKEYTLRATIWEPSETREQRATEQKRISERAAAVEKALLGPELRARYLIKVSSKHPGLRSVSWEVAEKRLEPASGGPIARPYVTLSLETIRSERQLSEIFSFLPFLQREPLGRNEYLTFDVDEEDIDDLVQTLQAAKAGLTQVLSGGSGE